jgi:hypothetical protein
LETARFVFMVASVLRLCAPVCFVPVASLMRPIYRAPLAFDLKSKMNIS